MSKSIIISNSLLYATYITIKKYENVNHAVPFIFINFQDMTITRHYGKGILKLANIYRKAGIKNVKVNLYHHKRHEVLFKKIMTKFGKTS